MSNKNGRKPAQDVAEFIEERIKGKETRKDFAERAGFSNTLISQWKAGETDTPDVPVLLKIADALRVDRVILLQKARILTGESSDPAPLPDVSVEDAITRDSRLTQRQKEIIRRMVEEFSHTPDV